MTLHRGGRGSMQIVPKEGRQRYKKFVKIQHTSLDNGPFLVQLAFCRLSTYPSLRRTPPPSSQTADPECKRANTCNAIRARHKTETISYHVTMFVGNTKLMNIKPLLCERQINLALGILGSLLDPASRVQRLNEQRGGGGWKGIESICSSRCQTARV